jgi:uncharacterized iron-regulated protein
MMMVSETVWAQLVTAWEEAARRYEVAWSAYEKIPLPDNDTETKSQEEEAYEAAITAENAREDRLLGVIAPHVHGVALQLRLFARRYHSIDVAYPRISPEDGEAAALRRIYEGLSR